LRQIEVLLVSGFGCKPCERVKERLQGLQAEFPELRVVEVDIGSEEGTALAVRHRLAALPGVLVNGRMALVGDVAEPLLRQELGAASLNLAVQG
jgi:thiol-disulfide isomerase/thioredoxin